MNDRFWATYLDWHIRTEHPWDVALHMEAMSLSIRGFQRALREALMPAAEFAAVLGQMKAALAR